MGAVLEKITSTPNGFGFNPFIYLQQLNGFFPTFQNNTTPNIASSNVQHVIRNANENNCANFKQKDSNRETFSPSSIGINNSEGPQSMLLKECLSISQKFLKEINDGEMMLNSSKNNLNKNGHQNNKKKKIGEERGHIYDNYNNLGNNIADNPNCHSSSSTTASPLPTTNFHHLNTLNNNFDIHSEEPLYFPQSPALCKILEGPGLEKTVFNTFTSSNELIEVSNVRAQLGLQSFEVMFAVHRLDSNILKPAQVHLVECIAPTKSDIRRFALFEQQHSNNNNSGNILFDKDEQFVIELSKIERLREKLAVMAFVAFRPSKLQSICSFNFPNGFSLLQILAKIVEKHYPELANFVSNEKSLVIGEAAKVNFACIFKELHLLERGQSLVEEELIYLTEETTSNNGCGKSQQQQQLAAFSAHLTTEIVHLKESMQSLKVCKTCYYLRVNFEKLILEVG
uniref:FH2 domain-containing protein n=1 Tax=Meloidogyne javanica TaxID=6303 RepID=A0A915MEW5_MELJA